MKSKELLVYCMLGGAVLAGCGTVRTARETQAELAPKGRGDVASHSSVALAGSSLEQLVGYALTNRPSVVSARLAVEDARLAVRQLRADAPLVSDTPWTSPRLSLSVGHSESSTADSHLRFETDGNLSGSLSLELLIWDFGRNSAQLAAASERVVAAEMTLAQAGYSVFEDVSSAYFALLEADALLAVSIASEGEYAEHLRQAQDRYEAGEARPLDVTRAKLDLAQARERVVAASNTVTTASAELMRSLGIDASGCSREDVLPPMSNALATVCRGFADTQYDAATAFDLARTNAPAMAVARARFRAASADVDYAVADLLPNVSASASVRFSDPLWLWSWGVDAVQSIFQGYRKRTAVERSVVALKAAAATVDEQEQELSHAVAVAIANRDNAVKAQESAGVSVAQAWENLELARKRYALGEASRVDYTDAVSAYAAALGSRVSAFYGGQTAEARLFALLGRLPAYSEAKEEVQDR